MKLKNNPAIGAFYSLTATIPEPCTAPCFSVKLPKVENYGQGDLIGRWSGGKNFPAPPRIGERVQIDMNGFGPGTVVGYFVETGWLGVEVKVDQRPDWHLKQNGDRHPNPLVFGSELRPVAAA